MDWLISYAVMAWDIALSWLLSPQAWSQFILLMVAFGAAWFVAKRLSRIITTLLKRFDKFQKQRDFVLSFLPLLLPLLAYGFAAGGAQITQALFDGNQVIAFGKRVFILIAVFRFVRDIVSDQFLRLLGRVFLIPIAVLYTLGILEFTATFLAGTKFPLGNLSFNLLQVAQFFGVGGLIFWLGRWSNTQSSQYLEAQEEIKPAMRQLAIKAAEIAIYGIAFILFMNIIGVDMGALTVLGGAIGVGLGFGLQKIASNFISGVILLLEGQATVGDFVELDGGEAGTIVKMGARAAILETFDGRWIVVPNEDFITTRVVNFSDSGSANRYEAPFFVSYDTDINKIPPLIENAVAKHPAVLSTPQAPDCELREFGENGVHFAVEFWVNGIDDGKNSFVSDILFVIWNCLRDNGIQIPYPQRVIHHKTP